MRYGELATEEVMLERPAYDRAFNYSVEKLREQGIKYFFCEKGILRLATDGTSWTVERLQ